MREGCCVGERAGGEIASLISISAPNCMYIIYRVDSSNIGMIESTGDRSQGS